MSGRSNLKRRRGIKGNNKTRIVLAPRAYIVLFAMALSIGAIGLTASSGRGPSETRKGALVRRTSVLKERLSKMLFKESSNQGAQQQQESNAAADLNKPAPKQGLRKAAAVAGASDTSTVKTKPKIGTMAMGKDYPYPIESVPIDFDFTTFVAKGGKRFQEYTSGAVPYEIVPTQNDDDAARSRRYHVKRAMQHAFEGYRKYAWGMDEVMPVSKTGANPWGGMGTTMVDSLDTLWLMGLKDEFYMCRDWITTSLKYPPKVVSFFETTIRSLGGLLSAYDWSGDKVFLDKALDLGSRMSCAFNTASGVPYGRVNLGQGSSGSNLAWTGGSAILAEAGTVQIEYRYLAKATNNPEYAQKAEKVFDVLNKMDAPDGLYPYYITNNSPTPKFKNKKITFGAMGDSFYEYMLKLWLQGGKKETIYRDMYDKSIQGMHDKLLQTSTPSGLVFIADLENGRLHKKMDHLVCFMGGLLALGAYTDPLGLDSERAQRDLTTARGLTYTCYQMYARMKTGIAPEFIEFKDNVDFIPGASHYLLRPETVESFFVLSYLTKDPIYREWGWEVFSAIERYCKTEIAYGQLQNVNDVNASPTNKMESFFLAETLKYLYLLFDPDTPVDILHKHVFNTEAHPVRLLENQQQEAQS